MGMLRALPAVPESTSPPRPSVQEEPPEGKGSVTTAAAVHEDIASHRTSSTDQNVASDDSCGMDDILRTFIESGDTSTTTSAPDVDWNAGGEALPPQHAYGVMFDTIPFEPRGNIKGRAEHICWPNHWVGSHRHTTGDENTGSDTIPSEPRGNIEGREREGGLTSLENTGSDTIPPEPRGNIEGREGESALTSSRRFLGTDPSTIPSEPQGNSEGRVRQSHNNGHEDPGTNTIPSEPRGNIEGREGKSDPLANVDTSTVSDAVHECTIPSEPQGNIEGRVIPDITGVCALQLDTQRERQEELSD